MDDLIQKTEQYVFELLKDNLDSSYTYHNFLHTQYVVSKIQELAEGEKVSEQEKQLLILAAMFHDAGYIDGPEGHEKKGAEIAEKFLLEQGLDKDSTDQIKQIILSTRLSASPQTHLERIIRDADCSNVGDPLFEEITKKLRREREHIEGRKINREEWDKRNYDFMTKYHRFYTDYAKEHWQPVKQGHVIRVLDRLKRVQKEEISEEEAEIKARAKAWTKTGRGLDTLFRITITNHTRLSDIADSKANILLSVNAIIISIALSTLLPKLSNPHNDYLIIPTLTMLGSGVVSIIFAILATRPQITKEIFSLDDVKKRKVNILFFGNFTRMDLEDYIDAMEDMMLDNEYLYNSFSRDLYFLGKVLTRKYMLLRITYTAFLIGTIVTVIAFIIAFAIDDQGLDLLHDN